MMLEGGAAQWYAEALLRNADSQHFFSYAILRKEEWVRVLRERGFAEEEGGAGGELAGAESMRMQRYGDGLWARYQLDSAGAMLIAALRYAPDVEPESAEARAAQGKPPLPLPEEGRAAVTIGRFARGNWYREMIERLAACARAASEGAAGLGLPIFSLKKWHRFSNSRFPEKALAVAAGLGTIGRNGLLIARRTVLEAQGCAVQPETGDSKEAEPIERATASLPGAEWSSAVVLGLMLLPFDVRKEASILHGEPIKPLALCGACQKCIDACPTRALSRDEGPYYERARCIQNYTSSAGALPKDIEAAWSNQLYGCDICLEACPHFKPDPEAHTALGRIGGTFDAASIAAMSDAGLRAAFKGSALDQKWIEAEALKRNAEWVARRHKLNKAVWKL